MNEYLQEYILLKKNYEAQGGDSASILALCRFADRLAASEQQQAKVVLADVCQYLFRCLHCGKYHLYVDSD